MRTDKSSSRMFAMIVAASSGAFSAISFLSFRSTAYYYSFWGLAIVYVSLLVSLGYGPLQREMSALGNKRLRNSLRLSCAGAAVYFAYMIFFAGLLRAVFLVILLIAITAFYQASVKIDRINESAK